MKLEDIEIKIKVDTTELDEALKKVEKLKEYTNCSVSGVNYPRETGNTVFEQSMANVASVSDATSTELEKMSGFAREMGKTNAEVLAELASDINTYLRNRK